MDLALVWASLDSIRSSLSLTYFACRLSKLEIIHEVIFDPVIDFSY